MPYYPGNGQELKKEMVMHTEQERNYTKRGKNKTDRSIELRSSNYLDMALASIKEYFTTSVYKWFKDLILFSQCSTVPLIAIGRKFPS